MKYKGVYKIMVLFFILLTITIFCIACAVWFAKNCCFCELIIATVFFVIMAFLTTVSGCLIW